MEWVLITILAIVGLVVVAVVVGMIGLVVWLVALPFRIIGWLIGAAACGVKLILLAPLLCLGLCALLLAAPLLFLLVAVF